jgi:hypothetical protein
MRIERRDGPVRIQFDPARNVTIMAVDGSWCHKCLLIDVSDMGAQLELVDSISLVEEFFLMLSNAAHPAFRRCKRVWVEGRRTGVSFSRADISKRLLERNSRNWESTPS